MSDHLNRAFVDESGTALIQRYKEVTPFFTPEGYAAYADDLIKRMINPYLSDAVERVGRDPERKLGWHDRLVGTIRLCLSIGVHPGRYALGAAAVLVYGGFLSHQCKRPRRTTARVVGRVGKQPAGRSGTWGNQEGFRASAPMAV